MAKTRVRVFVDTNVVIEAFRLNCWSQLCATFQVETVEKIVSESQAGDSGSKGYIPVDERELRKGLSAVHSVDQLTIALFVENFPDANRLDDGELHLLAWLWRQGPSLEANLLISTADILAIIVTGKLNWLDHLESLQHLAGKAGVSKSQLCEIEDQFTSSKLTTVRTQVKLETLK